jgi:imidazolonepropionase-like amidohydrolase
MKFSISMISIFILSFIIGSSKAEEKSVHLKYVIRAGKILTMTSAEGSDTSGRIINHGIILVSSGKIEALGPASSITVPEGYTLIDASDRWVMPGIVESHSHIAVDDYGFNDMVTPINPELSLAESVNPEDITIKNAVKSGITTVHTMPGSGTNLAGFSVIIKLDGPCPEKMILRELGAMKIAQAFNPERIGGDLGLTRMGMSWSLRQILKRAKKYTDGWEAYKKGRQEEPEYKPELEMMRKVFCGELPVISHTYDGWGVMQTMRIFNDENHLKTIPTHTAYGGHLIAKEAAKRKNVFINIGPRLFDFWMREGIHRQSARNNRFYGMGAEYYKAGVRNLSINTDAVDLGDQEELALQASMSARLGLDDEIALRAITINAARALGIDDLVGSLEVGKDADIVIKQGSLLEVTKPVDLVLISGKIAYQRKGVNLVAKEKQDSI